LSRKIREVKKADFWKMRLVAIKATRITISQAKIRIKKEGLSKAVLIRMSKIH
jgi:hypothetical protein